MKAIVLCAGAGTRLRPLTFARPKHLLPVAGRAVLDHVLESLAEAAIEEVVLVVGPESEHLRGFVGDGSRWGMRTEYVVQHPPRGLADAVRCAQAEVEGERFIVHLGDDLLGEGVSEFVSSFAGSDAQGSLIVKRVEDPRQFGVIVVEGDRVVGAVEKPPDPPSDLAIVGVYGFGPEVFDAIEDIEPSARGELEITDAIDLLAKRHWVGYRETEGFWEDVGSPESLLSANAFFLGRIAHRIEGEVDGQSSIEGRVQIAAGARVINSTVRGPCLIAVDCLVQESEVGPKVSLGEGCQVLRSQIVDSVLDEACEVEGVRGGLARSLLGRGVRVQGPRGVEAGAPLHMLAAYGTATAEAESG